MAEAVLWGLAHTKHLTGKSVRRAVRLYFTDHTPKAIAAMQYKLDAARAALARWQECAEALAGALRETGGECELVADFNESPAVTHSPDCRMCAALARFDAMKKEAGHE